MNLNDIQIAVEDAYLMAKDESHMTFAGDDVGPTVKATMRAPTTICALANRACDLDPDLPDIPDEVKTIRMLHEFLQEECDT